MYSVWEPTVYTAVWCTGGGGDDGGADDAVKVLCPVVQAQIYPDSVARKVHRSEWGKDKCRRALDNEWERLRTMKWPDGKGYGTWDESKVKEASEVREQARKSGKKSPL